MSAPLTPTRLPSEQKLEEMIVCDPRILSSEWLLIGRQESTNHGGRIDLLAIAPEGSLVLIALKHKTSPRERIAKSGNAAQVRRGRCTAGVDVSTPHFRPGLRATR